MKKILIEQAKQQLDGSTIQQNLIDLIETIIVYKLPLKSREGIEAMFGLSELKQTKVYQQAFEEGQEELKLEMITELFKEGLTIEQIARVVKLPLEVVQAKIDKSER